MEGPQQQIEASEHDPKISNLEKELVAILPLNQIMQIFGQGTFLIGGFLRDLSLDKNISNSDLDLMTRLPLETIVENFKIYGYEESENKEFEDNKYFFNSDKTIINTVISGRKVQVGIIGNCDVATLLSLGDITMNCCAFDIYEKKILNLQFMDDVLNKKLRFCSPEEARKDPWKIVSALKQISRVPNLDISQETIEIIRSCIPLVVNYFVDNPSEISDLKNIFGNINTKEVLDLFEGYDTKGIFENMPSKKQTLETSNRYNSVPIDQLDNEIRNKIIELAKKSYGGRLQFDKLFSDKINSVVYEIDDENNILSCCLISGERIYAIASVDADSIIGLVSDLCKHNHTVWTTISLSSKHIINLAQKAGLKLVSDPDLIRKILVNNYPEYQNKIIINQKRGMFVFVKEGSDDTEQVLLIS